MTRKFRTLLKLVLLFWYIQGRVSALAQTDSLVEISASPTDLKILVGYDFDKSWPGVAELVSALHNDGYLLARVDSIHAAPNSASMFLRVGEQYGWAYLAPGNVDEQLLRKIGFRERLYQAKPFRYGQINSLMKDVLDYAGSIGYPFAQVRLDSIGLSGTTMRASLKYESGPYITFDSLEISGDAKIKAKFLYQHLQIFPEKPFSEARVAEISRELSGLAFLQQSKPPELTFQNSQARVYLDLTNRPANQLDFILGVLPNSSTDGKMLLTGQLDLALRNLFGRGKGLTLDWLRYKEQSSNLGIQYHHPYLLGSVLSAKAGFELMREDSTFINRKIDLDLNFKLNPESLLYLNVEYYSSGLLNPEQFEQSSGLPDFSDVDVSYYGLSYTLTDLDQPFFAKKGRKYSLQALLGDKKISPNTSLQPEIYDSIDLHNIQTRFQAGLEHYFQLGPTLVLFSNLRSGFIFNENVFLNEMFRIGGFKTLRGFNENFFFASHYALSNLEGRVYLDPTSYLFVLYDQAYVRRDAGTGKFEDFPMGLGMGLSLGLKSGVFNFAFAMGRWEEEPLSFQLAKVHLGYINVF